MDGRGAVVSAGVRGALASLCLVFPVAEPAQAIRSAASAALRPAVVSTLPLTFEPAAPRAPYRFLGRGAHYDVLLSASELILAPVGGGAGRTPRARGLRMRFSGADPAATIVGADRLPGVSNYFSGDDPARWRVGVPHFARITVGEIYPGIDLVYYGRAREMEFDFVVAPGADPGRIQIDVGDADDVEVSAEDGDLVVQTPDGRFRLRRPHVYQRVDGVDRTVAGRYELRAESARRIGIRVTDYDAARPLVIDPVLGFASRIGGSATDSSNDVAVDDEGNVYLTGYTQSANFPVPIGESPNLYGLGGNADAFVIKLAPDGSTVLYSTFLGGTSFDEGIGIAVDDEHAAYVAGSTPSSDTGFPSTPGAYRTTTADFFLSKLGPTGELLYSTFFGGLNIGTLHGLALYGSGVGARVYLVGTTVSGFPTTVGAYRRSVNGTADAFLSILEPGQAAAADQLVYSTLLGGSSFDYGFAVAAGPNGHAYLSGSTTSTNFPLRHAFDTTYAGNREAFMTVFDPEQSGEDSLIYSTFIGGLLTDNGSASDGGVAVDSDGVALVIGTTNSSDFPVTPEGHRVSQQRSDGFLVVIDPSLPGGDSLRYGTFVGGSGTDGGQDVAAGAPGIAYVAGYAQSDDLPGGDGGIAPKIGAGAPGAGQDAFFAKFDWTRVGDASLIDAGYIGGTAADVASAVAVDGDGNVYLTGETSSGAPFLPSPGPGSPDAFVAHLGTTIELPLGTIGRPSIDVLRTSFGTPPLSWALLSGTLPDGLVLDPDGTLSGEPTESGASTFTVEITDALADTHEQSYRKRIGAGAVRGDVLIRKAGLRAVPGRQLPYYILLRNRTDHALYDVGVVELLQPWFTFLSSSPPPTLLEPRPGNVHWTIPRMDPGELKVIAYTVALPPDFPFDVEVQGEACLTDETCNAERAECEDEGKELCENTLCVGNGSGAQCIGCNQDESNRCRDKWNMCKGLVGQGSAEDLEEGAYGGGCHTHSGFTGGPLDPNEKDASSSPFIPAGEMIGYTVHFENIGDVEAKDVFVTDVLDADLDLSTVQVLRPLGGLVPLSPDSTVSIFEDDDERWSASLDGASRTLSWELLNIDLPAGATDGLFFVVQAPEGLPTGTEIRNDATIQFEVFEPLATNETLNVVDATAPTCTMDALPASTSETAFTISWTAADPVGEIGNLFVFVSADGGPFTQLLATTASGSTTFTGEAGGTYGFFCVAMDTAGNVEPHEQVAETTTTVSGTATTTTMIAGTTTTTIMLEPGTLLPGRKLLVTQKKSGSQGVQIIAKDPSIEPASPCGTEGELVIETVGVGAASRSFPLAANLWKPIKPKKPEKGCKYGDDAGTKVLIKAGKLLKVVAKGGDVRVPLDDDPRPVRTELRHGGLRYCMEFLTGKYVPGKKLLTKNAMQATTCP